MSTNGAHVHHYAQKWNWKFGLRMLQVACDVTKIHAPSPSNSSIESFSFVQEKS